MLCIKYASHKLYKSVVCLSHLNAYRYTILEMDVRKTHKHSSEDSDAKFKMLLEDSAREAYIRPWHRIERGLRLNRLRIFIEDISPQYEMTAEERESFFTFLQKSLYKKLLNTLKVVLYNQETQRITMIKGLEIKRNQEGVLKWIFKQKTDATRKKKHDLPSVSTCVEVQLQE